MSCIRLKKFVMSKRISAFYLILFFVSCICVALQIFGNGLYMTHDGVNHVARFAAYIRAFHEFHIPPRWAGYLNYSYGSPVFNFFYPLPGYIAFLLSGIINNPETIFKVISFAAFIFAPITFFSWIKEFVQKPYAVAVSGMYGLSLYHVANLLVRGDVAELVSILFIPLVLLCIDQKKYSLHTVVFGGISYALTILSHNGISLLFTPVIAIYMALRFFESRKLQRALSYIGMLSVGLSLSAFFWIPALFEKKYTNIALFTGDFYSGNFLNGFAAFVAPWGFGPDVNAPGGFAPQLGIIPVILCTIVIFRLIYIKKMHNEVLFWIAVLLFSTIMTMPISQIIWKQSPFLKIIQFPWRFIAIANFALFAAISVGLKYLKPTSYGIPMLLLSITLVCTLPYIRVAGYEKRPATFYTNFPNTTYFHGEATTVWSTGDFAAYPAAPVEVVSGIATVSGYVKSNASHTYTVNADTTADIVDNTLYYPGWQVRDNGIKLPIEFQNQHHRGLITFKIPKGSHEIVVSFHETPLRLASDLISGIMCTAVIAYMTLKLLRHANT